MIEAALGRRIPVAVAVAAAVALVAVAATPAGARASRGVRHATDSARDCNELVPEAYAATGVTDSGQSVVLDVLVLTDGVEEKRAHEVMARVGASYAPLKVTVAASYQTVVLADDGPVAMDGEEVPTGDADRLIEESRALVGGTRPEGIDVVYTLTNKDLFDYTDEDGDHQPDEGERDYDLVGRADCIGGVRYPEAAFAIGEDYREENTPFGPLNTFVAATPKIAAHEIGHLLGAHHHYSNCVEGTASELSAREVSPCTLMVAYLELASQNFGAAEAAVVRGHAVRYASP